MITFGLISPMAAGKGTVADYLVNTHHAKAYRFSDPINEILRRLHIPNSRENQIKIGAGLREMYGNGVWAETLKQDVLRDKPAIAVIDGIRYPEDLEVAKTLPHFTLIAIEAFADLRYDRLKKRNDRPGEDTMDRTKFDKQHESATEINIASVMKKADVVLENNGTYEELYAKIEELVKKSK